MPYFYLRCLSESRSSTWSTRSVRPSICQSIRNTFGVPSLCNLQLQKFSFLFIQTLYNDCSHIEDVHHLLCAHFMNFFSLMPGGELRHFNVKNALCLVCVFCNSKKFLSFIFKLCIMIVHTLKMCTSYFVNI